jgi:hypothetical protein
MEFAGRAGRKTSHDGGVIHPYNVTVSGGRHARPPPTIGRELCAACTGGRNIMITLRRRISHRRLP